jgi:hypothetical protein
MPLAADSISNIDRVIGITSPEAGERCLLTDFGDTWVQRERPMSRNTMSVQGKVRLNLHSKPSFPPAVSTHK